MNEYKIYYSADIKKRNGYYSHQDGELTINTYKQVLKQEEFHMFIDKKLNDYENLIIKDIIKCDFINKIVNVNNIIQEFFYDLDLNDEILNKKLVDMERMVIELYGKVIKIPYNYSLKLELSKEDDKFLINVYYPRFNKEDFETFDYQLDIAKIVGFLYFNTDIFIGSESIRNDDIISFEECSSDKIRTLYDENKSDEALTDFGLMFLLPTSLITILKNPLSESDIDEQAKIISEQLNIQYDYILRRLYLNKTLEYVLKDKKEE